jgi:hypothetical protein
MTTGRRESEEAVVSHTALVSAAETHVLFSAWALSKQFPIILWVKVSWKEGKAMGSVFSCGYAAQEISTWSLFIGAGLALRGQNSEHREGGILVLHWVGCIRVEFSLTFVGAEF